MPRYDDRERRGAPNPEVLRVAREMSERLSRRGIKHALIGGLAVGAHGYDRATRDADFLVSGDAQGEVAGDALGGEVWGKTVVVDGVDVDLLFPRPDQEFLEGEIDQAKMVGGMPTISVEALVYLKLVASRARDLGDVVELIKRGKAKKKSVVAFLAEHRPDLVEDFESLAAQAEHEED